MCHAALFYSKWNFYNSYFSSAWKLLENCETLLNKEILALKTSLLVEKKSTRFSINNFQQQHFYEDSFHKGMLHNSVRKCYIT